MLTFKKYIEPTSGMPGWRVWIGDNLLGTVFNPGPGPGMPWQGVAPDGTRFGERSRPKLAQRLRVHAAAKSDR